MDATRSTAMLRVGLGGLAIGAVVAAFVAALPGLGAEFVGTTGMESGASYHSFDGINWNSASTPIQNDWQSSVWDGTNWIIVAGTGNPHFVYSANLVTFSQVNCCADTMYGMAATPTRVVATSSGGTGIYTSIDHGQTWTAGVVSPGAQDMYGVATDGVAWVAVGATNFIRSTDGVNWSVVDAPGGSWGDVEVSTTAWVAYNGNGCTRRSTNAGATWTAGGNVGACGAGSTNDALMATDGSKVLVIRTPNVYTSTDGGLTWTVTATLSASPLRAMAYDGCRWVIQAGNLGQVYQSFDGNSWTLYAGFSNLWDIGTKQETCPPLCSAAPSQVIAGAPVTFTATMGVPPYNWIGSAGSPSPATGASSTSPYQWTTTFNSGGYVSVQVSDSQVPPRTNTCWVTVVPQLQCGGPSALVAGQSGTYTANGGTGSYSWTTNPSGPTGNAATFVVAFAAPGSYQVQVSDPTPQAPQTATCQVNVIPPLECLAPAGPILTGSSATFSVSGGSGSTTWTGGGNPASWNGGSFTTQFATAGNHVVQAASSGPPTQTDACPPLEVVATLTCFRAAPTALVGETVVWYVTGGQGLPTWSGTGGSPSTASGDGIAVTHGSEGTYAPTVQSPGPPAQSAVCPAVTVAYPPLACTPANPLLGIGEAAYATATGGSGTYSWSAPSGIPASGSGSEFNTTFQAGGLLSTFLSSGMQSTQCLFSVLDPDAPPMRAPYPDTPFELPPPGAMPPTARAESSATCGDLSVVLDGTGSWDRDGMIIAWEWTLGDGTSASGPTVEHRYAARGDYAIRLVVTDDLGQQGRYGLDVRMAPCPPLVLTASEVRVAAGTPLRVCPAATGGNGRHGFFVPPDAPAWPEGAFLDESGCVSWDPSTLDGGRHCLAIAVTDGDQVTTGCMGVEVTLPAPTAAQGPDLPDPPALSGEVRAIAVDVPDNAPGTQAMPPPSRADADSSVSAWWLLLLAVAALAFVAVWIRRR